MARSILVVAYLVCASALISKNIEKQEEDKPHKKQKKPDELKENASEGLDKEEGQKASKVLMTNGKTITVAAEYHSGRSKAERAAMPKFSLKGGPAPTANDGFSWARYRWNYDNPGMVKHPARVWAEDKAQFVVTCCLAQETKGHFLNLPKRSPERPYLVKALDGKKAVQEILDKRPDMYVLNYDLRDSMAPGAEPLRGVTIAPHNYFAGNPRPENAPRKFFITFQGRKTSKLRHELHDAFNAPESKYRHWKNISVETIMDRNHNVQQQTGDAHFNMKMDTTYSLLPKGDDRWSLRFSEAIGAGAIPVVLAQGLTLPYENIIDWSKAAIYLPNSYAKDANKIMAAIPTDEETIMKMRHEVYEINRKYFATPEARADAMLLDAAALVQKKGKYQPTWDYLAQPKLVAAFKEMVSDGQI